MTATMPGHPEQVRCGICWSVNPIVTTVVHRFGDDNGEGAIVEGRTDIPCAGCGRRSGDPWRQPFWQE